MVSIAYALFNMELGMSPTSVAVILMSLRLWDGVADPVMGWISDNTRTRWGRRRPYIFVGAILAALTYPLIWWFPRGLSESEMMQWVIGFGILFYTCFTIWAMPFQCMIMEMTPDYNERTRVAEIRGYFQSLAGLVVGFSWWIALRPMFAVANEAGEMIPSTSNGMRYISIAISVVIAICGVLPAIFVKERYYENELTNKQEKLGLFKSLKDTFSNGPFVILSIFTVFFLLGTSIYDSYGRYVGTYYVLGGDWGRSSEFVAIGTILYTVCSMSILPYFRNLSSKIGKVKCLSISVVIVLISNATTWFTHTPDMPYLMLVNTIFIGVGYAGLWLMIPSMQADVVDYDEMMTGERREGSFASIYSWVLKLSFCVGYLISGPLLEWSGFDSTIEGPQPEEVLTNMRIGYTAIPIVSLSLALVLLKFFKITPEKAKEIRAALESKRGEV
jgi:GPH family glycoside/pentoside/hexuronide:cation symporter